MTLLLLGCLIGQGPVAGIALPPAPSPPGWTPIASVTPFSSPVVNSLAGRPDGSAAYGAGLEYDPIMAGYNVSVFARTAYGWNNRQVQTWFTWVNSISVATTDQPDRAGVFADVGASGGPGGLYVSFISQGALAPTPQLVSDTDGVQYGALAATPEGNVMVVWMNINGSYALYSNHSADAAGWDGNQSITVNESYINSFRLVAVGPDSFLAIWQDYDGMFFHLWGSIHTGSGAWSAPADLVTPSEDMYGLAAAGSAPAGRGAIATWTQNGLNATLTLVKYTAAGFWGPEQIAYINGTGTNAVSPGIAVDARGYTHLVWGEAPELSTVSDITYKREDPDLVWSEAARFTITQPDYLQIAASDDGGVAISWVAFETYGKSRMYVAREVPGSGWRPTEMVDEAYSATHSVFSFFATLATGGNYTAMWDNFEGTQRQLLYRAFIAGNDPPALAVTGPTEGSVSTSPTVLVQGVTAPGATVEVSGVAAAVGADGKFSLRVALAAGANPIHVVATDQWHNTAQTWVNVTFADPVPGLQQNLTAAQADIQAAHELTHTVQQSADSANTRANNLSNQLNLSNAVVQHMQTDMDFLKASSGNTTAADAKAAAAQSAAGTATILAVLGVVIGLAGVGMALMKGRAGGGGRSPTRTENPPAESKPPSQSGGSGPDPSPPAPPQGG